ncbi:unnamed protein product [Urochloa humidicola]
MGHAEGELSASAPAPPPATPAPASTTTHLPSAQVDPAAPHPSSVPAISCMPPPASPASRPEKVDWGDIEDDDEDEDDEACSEGTDSAIAGHARGGVTQGIPLPGESVAAFTTGTDLGGGHGSPIRPLCSLRSAAGPSEAPSKLKSVLVVPSSPRCSPEPHHTRPDHRGKPPPRRDSSPPWQPAKSKRRLQSRSFPSSSTPSRRSPSLQLAKDGHRSTPSSYKEALRGRCFRCLAKDHRLAQCRDPPRCLLCRASGHLARRCPRRANRPIHSRLTFPSTSIHSRITFPPPDIQSRLTFPPLQASPRHPPPSRRTDMAYTAGAPSQRPVEGHAVISVEGAMAAELRRLRCTGVVLTGLDRNYTPEPLEVQRAMNQQLRIPLHNIAVSCHKSEDFFARLDHPDQAEQAVRKGTVDIGGTSFLIQPWRETAYSRPANWYFHCKVVIERLPLYAWCEDGVRQALGDFCSFDYIEHISFTQENTERLSCWVWMWNPDQLPRSKLTTIFPEGAGWSRPGVTAAPPVGNMVDLIFHLDSYFDWSPPPASRTPSSRASGLPSSSSLDSDGRPFPFFQDFTWYAGLLDGHTPRGGIPRIINAACRGMPPVARRDRDEDDEDRRGPRRHWSEHIAARGRPIDDVPRQGSGRADRYRSRSPAQHGRHHDSGSYNLSSRGRCTSRSPPSPSRQRDPACRDDEGWERRRSRSPVLRRGMEHVRGPRSDGPWTVHAEQEHARHGHLAGSTATAEEARRMAATIPPRRLHPDPIIDFLAGLCQNSGRCESFLSRPLEDPMLLEVAGAMQQRISYSPSASPTAARYNDSPTYVPVSDLWTRDAVAEDRLDQRVERTGLLVEDPVATRLGCGVADGRTGCDVADSSVASGLGCDVGGVSSGLGCGGQGAVETLVDQVHNMDIDGPTAANEAEAEETARAQFFNTVFAEVPQPVLAVPAPPAPTPAPVPQRQSERLRARPSSVPVSRRATHRLIRELDFVGDGEAIGDEAVAKYERMYQGPVPRKSVAALAAVTRVASGVVMAASAALAAEAAAAQVEAM